MVQNRAGLNSGYSRSVGIRLVNIIRGAKYMTIRENMFAIYVVACLRFR